MTDLLDQEELFCTFKLPEPELLPPRTATEASMREWDKAWTQTMKAHKQRIVNSITSSTPTLDCSRWYRRLITAMNSSAMIGTTDDSNVDIFGAAVQTATGMQMIADENIQGTMVMVKNGAMRTVPNKRKSCKLTGIT